MMQIFQRGDRVRVSYHDDTVLGRVTIASGNGRSLVIEFEHHMLGGFVGMIPVFWDEKTQGFIDLMVNDPVSIEAA
jgi:hypothetical protein